MESGNQHITPYPTIALLTEVEPHCSALCHEVNLGQPPDARNDKMRMSTDYQQLRSSLRQACGAMSRSVRGIISQTMGVTILSLPSLTGEIPLTLPPAAAATSPTAVPAQPVDTTIPKSPMQSNSINFVFGNKGPTHRSQR
jgi:hypothetical protein